ncbi:Uncharacterized protein SCF082_LOCUS37740 [Durusdinium trenchii]|uniref:Uncharacterized protein n=1 Tax=Durusdinium trenchii TaxID=1381693 RepID=A0ABP0PSQ9_9DINO
MAQIVLGPSNFSTTGAARVAYSLGVHDPALGKMALRGILSSKSESNLRLSPHSSVGDSDDVASNGYPRRAASTRSRTNSGRMLMPQEIEHPWETCPFQTLFVVVQDMLALKYGVQLDEFDFVNKAKAMIALISGLELNSTALALDVLIEGDMDSPRSLAWLWQTVAATCCWAVSDVICDACIRPPAAVEDVEPPSPPTDSEPKGTLRRRRPKPLSNLVEQAAKPLRRVNSPRLRPCTQLLPEVPAIDWSLDGQADEDSVDRLTPEQNALMSGFVALMTAAACNLRTVPYASLSSTRLALAGAGGFFHFTAYLCTLCAFTSASSTVITPLMQLSALWMLPFSTSAASLGFAPVIRPLHLVAVLLICVGGFLPAADGCISSVATGKFWQQKAVRFVVLGEFLICCYNVILHQATFAESSDPELATHPLQFFLASRVANGLTCALLFLAIPSLRRHLWALRKVKRRFFATAFLGECLSMTGVCLVTFSYSGFYEPSVVNAVEGGLQQLFNLMFATCLS